MLVAARMRQGSAATTIWCLPSRSRRGGRTGRRQALGKGGMESDEKTVRADRCRDENGKGWRAGVGPESEVVTDRATQAWYHPSMAWMAPNRRVTWQATSDAENS